MNATNRLKAALVEQQGTNKWLADQLGKSEIAVPRWCSNKVQPSMESFVEIAKVPDIWVRMPDIPTKDRSI